MFKGLADESRLRILKMLSANQEMNVTQIAETLRQSQPAVSHHLNQLRVSGLVEYRREGKFNIYRLSENGLQGLFTMLSPNSPIAELHIGGLEMKIAKAG
ncbi:MAG: ArsR/SmtB family transcription factor [Fimbriiglobus sp.]